MVSTIELLRNVAGVMFWALADVILGGIWIGIVTVLLGAVLRGHKDAD